MVKYFHFRSTNEGDERSLDCKLISERCDHIMQSGNRCRKRCLIGLTKCWIHLESVYGLRIRDAGALGQGLFASNGDSYSNDIVFRPDDYIISYVGGDELTEAQVEARYGVNNSGPYAMRVGDGSYQDCAIRRCAASLINSNRGTSTRSNCEFVDHTDDDGNAEILVICTRNIRNGQQLFISYGREYRFNENNVQSWTDMKQT